ncbi:hypothetical protein [Halodesulfovibrio sp. MK-HDV]|uniref:hypothetical protein n=1 Tax=Halodesulfovibrio sp. MK-HDV TaxID=2599925 RepID=UPI00136D02B5|nr:hypothetical protein [Halodesulfovibrio sp. MK-HDV]KAF1077667.1 hypothetical protein MKHDV_00123 [Halodesulfovibrio sp. MK-HDV]
MVKIPTSSKQSQLSDAPVTNLQQGAAFGQGINALGRVVQQIGEKERTRQDNDQFLAARTKYDAWNLEFETQAAQRQGESAAGLTRDFQQAEQEKWQEISSDLNPRVAHALEQHRGGQLGSKNKLHAFAEHQGKLTVAKNNFSGSMAVLKQEMLDTPYDIDTHVAKATQNFDLGVSSGAVLPSQREMFMVEVAGMKKTAWQALYDQAPEEALKQTGKYGISGSMKSVYAEKHKDKVTSTQSLAITNELAGNGKSLKENLDYAHEKYADNPALHDKVVQRLKLRGSEETTAIAAAEKATKKDLVAQLYSVEVDPSNRGAASEQLMKIVESAPVQMREEIYKKANSILNPSELTDMVKLAKVEQSILDKDITKVEDLRLQYDGISLKHQQQLEETLRKVNKDEVPALTIGKANRILAQFGFKQDLSNKEKMRKFNDAHAVLQSFYKERNPRNLVEEQETNVSFREYMEQEGIIPDGGTLWGDKNLTRAEAIASQKIAEFLPDVSEENQSKIMVTTKALGVDVKDEKQLLSHNKAWLPVYQRLPEEHLQQVVSLLQAKKRVVTPQSVMQVYARLTQKKG